MRNKILALVVGAAFAALMLTPEPAAAQRGFRGGGVGMRGVGISRVGIGRVGIGRVGIGRVGLGGVGYRGVGLGYRGVGLGVRRAGIGWGGVGWRRGLAWRGHYPYYGWRRPYWGLGAAAVIGAGIAASSYYGYGYDYGYPAAYGDGYYGGCPLVQQVVWTGWGYRTVLVQACY